MNRLLRLLNDNRGLKADARGLSVRNAVDVADGVATVYLYDTIVSDPLEAEYWGGIAAESFVREFNAIDAPQIHIRINSPGGDVFAARAMEQAIRSKKSKVTCFIDGYAASAASIIAMAGEECYIADGAFLMIHKSWSIGIGNADDLRKTAALLDQVDDTLIATYARRTGLADSELRQMLADETWLNAEDAVKKKFCTAVSEPESASARIDWNISALRDKSEPSATSESGAMDRANRERMLNHLERVPA